MQTQRAVPTEVRQTPGLKCPASRRTSEDFDRCPPGDAQASGDGPLARCRMGARDKSLLHMCTKQPVAQTGQGSMSVRTGHSPPPVLSHDRNLRFEGVPRNVRDFQSQAASDLQGPQTIKCLSGIFPGFARCRHRRFEQLFPVLHFHAANGRRLRRARALWIERPCDVSQSGRRVQRACPGGGVERAGIASFRRPDLGWDFLQ